MSLAVPPRHSLCTGHGVVFFGLRENPFHVTPDPRFLVMTDQMRRTLAELTYVIVAVNEDRVVRHERCDRRHVACDARILKLFLKFARFFGLCARARDNCSDDEHGKREPRPHHPTVSGIIQRLGSPLEDEGNIGENVACGPKQHGR